MNPEPKASPDESTFLEFRRKVQASELLSAAVDKLLRQLRFSGRLSIVLQNGRVLKSGYEEGYFRHRDDLRLIT
jgi:sulfur carrier protein ThiS